MIFRNPFIFGIWVCFLVFIGTNLAAFAFTAIVARAITSGCTEPCDGNPIAFVSILFLSFLASIAFAIVGGIVGYRYKKKSLAHIPRNEGLVINELTPDIRFTVETI